MGTGLDKEELPASPCALPASPCALPTPAWPPALPGIQVQLHSGLGLTVCPFLWRVCQCSPPPTHLPSATRGSLGWGSGLFSPVCQGKSQRVLCLVYNWFGDSTCLSSPLQSLRGAEWLGGDTLSCPAPVASRPPPSSGQVCSQRPLRQGATGFAEG